MQPLDHSSFTTKASSVHSPIATPPAKPERELFAAIDQRAADVARAEEAVTTGQSRYSERAIAMQRVEAEAAQLRGEIEVAGEALARGALSDEDLIAIQSRLIALEQVKKAHRDALGILERDVAKLVRELEAARHLVKKARAELFGALLWKRLPELATAYRELLCLFHNSRISSAAATGGYVAPNLGALLAEICPQLRDAATLQQLADEIFQDALRRGK